MWYKLHTFNIFAIKLWHICHGTGCQVSVTRIASGIYTYMFMSVHATIILKVRTLLHRAIFRNPSKLVINSTWLNLKSYDKFSWEQMSMLLHCCVFFCTRFWYIYIQLTVKYSLYSVRAILPNSYCSLAK